MIKFHPFADGGVLHLGGSHRLWVLNLTAAILWCLLDGQTDADDIAFNYGQRFGIDQAAARQDVTAFLARFEKQGLLNGGRNGPPNDRYTVSHIELPCSGTKIKHSISGPQSVTLSLVGNEFLIAIANIHVAKVSQTIFHHLLINTQPTGNCVDLRIRQRDLANNKKRDRAYFGCENDIRTEDNLDGNEIIPWLIYKLFDYGMAALHHRLLFHAAVVAKDGRALLLPAVSGSGKSTLAAALTTTGWTYLSDELAVVNPQNLNVEPFALPVGLKDKSMAALASFIPGVGDLPRHIRADGIGVRYFAPPETANEGRLPIEALVFPRYSSGSPTKLKALEPLESLEGLAATGSSARPLASEDIAAILQLASLPGYRLQFADLEAAVELIDRRRKIRNPGT